MAEINLSRFLADRLRGAGTDLYNACKKMPEDRIAWHPTVEGNAGRDALDQALECAFLNEWAAGTFQTGAVPSFDEAAYKNKGAGKSSAEALEWLKSATESLAAAVEGCSAARLASTVKNPFTQQDTTLAALADFFYWNTVYHEGQVNYIQVLYGDMS